MIVKVDNLVKGHSKAVELNGEIEMPENYCVGNIASVVLNGTITNTDGKYAFEGKVVATLNLSCNSCNKEFQTTLSFDMFEIFSKDDNLEEDEWTFTDKNIDLKSAVASNIILNMPMKNICSKTCKGLCHICGHNLNESDCGCDRTNYDPRFEMLRSLINDKEV